MKVVAILLGIIATFFQPEAQPSVINNDIKVFLVGDIMLGRTVMTTSLDNNDFTYPFVKVSEKLNEADLVFANLENPFVDGCPRHTDGFKFCADPRLVEGLKKSKISVVTIANNHTKNYGEAGLLQTKEVLMANGIDYVGDNNLVIKQIKDTKFGFLGFDFLTNNPKESDYKLVSESDKRVDILIVGVHWGVEYKAIANDFQKNTAKALIEAGADVIAGHHPHWVQNVEYIDDKPVYYSLGNFVFDQMWSEETKKGVIAELNFRNKSLISEKLIPTYIKERGQPIFVSE